MWAEDGYLCTIICDYDHIWLWRANGVLHKSSLYPLQDETRSQALWLVFLLSTYGSGATFGKIRRWGSCCMIESGRRDHFSVLCQHRARLHRQQVTDHMAQKERCWKLAPLRLALVSSSLACFLTSWWFLPVTIVFSSSVVMSLSEGCLFPGYVLFYVMLHPVF